MIIRSTASLVRIRILRRIAAGLGRQNQASAPAREAETMKWAGSAAGTPSHVRSFRSNGLCMASRNERTLDRENRPHARGQHGKASQDSRSGRPARKRNQPPRDRYKMTRAFSKVTKPPPIMASSSGRISWMRASSSTTSTMTGRSVESRRTRSV